MLNKLNKKIIGGDQSRVIYLLSFIKENGLDDKLSASLDALSCPEESKPSVYNIEAHSEKVADLPLHLMNLLHNTMLDISYANDDAARFTALHEDGDKAYHLWIGHPEEAMRDDFEPRFSLSIVGLEDYDTGGEHDFAGHLTMDTIATIADTDSIDEISKEIRNLSSVLMPVDEHATDFLMQIFEVPKELSCENIKIKNSNILSWELINITTGDSDNFTANIRFHTVKPVTLSELDGEVCVSSDLFDIQGSDVFITSH